MSLIFYSRPPHVSRSTCPIDAPMCQKLAERMAGKSIPDDLSFDNMLAKKTLPPCQLQDFMDYLVFVVHDAENLQFYLWLRQYKSQFERLIPVEKELSQPWNPDRNVPQSSWSNDTAIATETKLQDEGEPNKQRGSCRISRAPTELDVSASLLYEIQPLRKEVENAIRTYIAPGSPRELNISSHERVKVLEALQKTTHPSAFGPIEEIADAVLRNQSYPNFVRYAICNGNKPRIVMIRMLSVLFILLSVFAVLMMVLSRISRWYRILPLPLTFLGIVGIITAARGLCLILTVQTVQVPKQWQMQDGAESVKSAGSDSFTQSLYTLEDGQSDHSRYHTLFDPFGPENGVVSCTLDEFECAEKDWKSGSLRAQITALQGAFSGPGRAVKNDLIQQMRMGIILKSHLEALIIVIGIGAGLVAIPVVAVL